MLSPQDAQIDFGGRLHPCRVMFIDARGTGLSGTVVLDEQLTLNECTPEQTVTVSVDGLDEMAFVIRRVWNDSFGTSLAVRPLAV